MFVCLSSRPTDFLPLNASSSSGNSYSSVGIEHYILSGKNETTSPFSKISFEVCADPVALLSKCPFVMTGTYCWLFLPFGHWLGSSTPCKQFLSGTKQKSMTVSSAQPNDVFMLDSESQPNASFSRVRTKRLYSLSWGMHRCLTRWTLHFQQNRKCFLSL